MNCFWCLLKRVGVTTIVPADTGIGGVAAYPNKPIHIMVPFTLNGPTDVLARIVGKKLSERSGQPVVVDNQPGTNGIEGTNVVAKAAPDGYTLLLAASAHYINPSIYRKLPFDPIKDFAPISLLISGPNVLVVHPSVPARSVGELIAFAQAHPGELRYASGGVASPSHLAAELLKIMAGVDLVHVPYDGHVPAGRALGEGREAQLMFDAGLMAMSNIKSGKLRALGVTSTKRVTALPEVPTIAEAGLPGYEVSPAIGVLAPAGTPPQIINRLSQEIAKIMQMSDVKAPFQSGGAEPVGNTPEEFGAYMKAEVGKWAKVVKAAGIQPLDLPS